MKIVHVSTVHNRYDTRIFEKECKSLVLGGYSVAFLVADGLGNEIKNEVCFFDVGRFSDRISRVTLGFLKVIFKARKLNGDIYHFHDPELILLGLLFKCVGKKVIFDIHEDYPAQIMCKNYIWSPIRKTIAELYNWFEKTACKYLDYVIVPQQSMRKKYDQFVKTEVVENFAFFPKPGKSVGKELTSSRLMAFQAGSLSEERGLLNLLNAVEKIPSSINLEFVLAGKMTKDLEKKVSTHPSWKRIKQLGKVPFEIVKQFYTRASIGFILNNNVGQYKMCNAIKQFEYMANGIPFLMPDFGEWKEFNERFNCGINVNPVDSGSVADAFVKLVQNVELARKLGERGRIAFKDHFTWGIAEKKLLKVYEELQNA